MIGRGLKARSILTFATILILAMSLQSMIFIFSGIRSLIQDDIAWAKHALQSFATDVSGVGESETANQALLATYKRFQVAEGKTFSCLSLDVTELSQEGKVPCRYPDELLKNSQKALLTNRPVVELVGLSWNIFLIRSEVASFAIPIMNPEGKVRGTISAERSLLPIYNRHWKLVPVILCYLIVNVIIFVILWYVRMERILYRPLERLVQKAENYNPDQQTLFLISDDESAIRKLSVSLNAMLDRIERDNKKLRLNVSELEEVNRALKEKNDLVIRSEKLASVGRLSAGLAHEIGNPLSIVQGYVELLSRPDLTDDEKKQFSEKSYKELDRIKRLIRQLLDYSGSRRSTEEVISVNALVVEIINFLALEKSFSRSCLLTKLLAANDQIIADKDALRQVLINCLFNAIDATIERGDENKEIEIESFNSINSDHIPVINILIKDNGIGIEKDQLGNVFDPFYTTKEVGKGTGLGLFVCHTIMEKMGGAIRVSNRNHTGVEVHLEIPMKQDATTA